MRYVVELDLNYVLPQTEVHGAWEVLRAALLDAGFHADGRRFVSNQEPSLAARAAQSALETVDRRLRRQGRTVYSYVRDFYGYPVGCAQNLLVPSPSSIDVREPS